MPLVKVKDIYRKAREGGYGVAGFCAENLEMAQAILDAAEEGQAPVVVALWEEDIKVVGQGYLEAIVRFGASQVSVPVAIMLDHGSSLESCLRSIMHGHTGVMIDASHAEFEGNVAITREVCRAAHLLDVLVEGEVGTVRRSFESTGAYSEETVLTDPEMVPVFVRQTGVDAVAVSIGTESGIPASPVKLDFQRLDAIAHKTDAYLILHGGSGTTARDVSQAVECGATAFRFASEIRLAYLDALVRARKSLPKDFPDTRLIYRPARQAAKKAVLKRMEHLGCLGKAW
jgi:ketose-bisphosphate aldolase